MQHLILPFSMASIFSLPPMPASQTHLTTTLRSVVALLTFWATIQFIAPSLKAQTTDTLMRVIIRDSANNLSEIDGRLLAQTQDKEILLERRNGKLLTLASSRIESSTNLQKPFSRLPADSLANELLSELGAGFQVTQTVHFVICSDASDRYTAYCGRLLERVHDEFQEFFDGSAVTVTPLSTKLPVLIFGRPEAFQQFARLQHPDTDFSDVPGYYSVRDNQMLISAVSGDRSFRTNSDVLRELKKQPRQIETIVHETVHQLAFNMGVQVRFADNPTWLSEGLAVYFEQASGRGSIGWHRPGGPSRIHVPGFRSAASGSKLRLPLAELTRSDAAFQNVDRLADAYAESWALTYYLIRKDRPAFEKLLLQLQTQKPLRSVSPETRLQRIREATGKSLTELETDLIRYMSVVRAR